MRTARHANIAQFTALALTLGAGCTGVIDSPTGRPGSEVGVDTASGIRLEPPDGIARRALECEADYAPLRRMNHTEYRNTIADLTAGWDVPETTIAIDSRRESFTNNFEMLNPSELLIRQYYENASAIAAAAAPQAVAELDCSASDACFRQFVTDFGRRAYRRPLTSEEVDDYARYFGEVAPGNFELAVEMAMQAMLQAPDFIYRPEFGGDDSHLDQFEIASRLSYFIWASMPDDMLLDAAENNRLTGDSLADEVDRMMTDPRARAGLLRATADWLELDRLATTVKAEEYAFTPEVRADLRESVEMFLWDRVFADDGSLDDLMTSPGAYVNERIGPIFGVNDAGPEMEWREVEHRSGLLTHPAVLAVHAHDSYGSPVLRGVFILRELLCDAPSPPPDDIAMGDPPTEDGSGAPITNRDGYERLTQSQAQCATCHDRINPIGFAFESFDTVGAYRTSDNGTSVDTTGSSRGFTLREEYDFQNASELTSQVNEGLRFRACIVDRWVRYASGGGSLAYDPCVREELESIATSPGASLRDVVIAIALNPKFANAEVVSE